MAWSLSNSLAFLGEILTRNGHVKLFLRDSLIEKRGVELLLRIEEVAHSLASSAASVEVIRNWSQKLDLLCRLLGLVWAVLRAL